MTFFSFGGHGQNEGLRRDWGTEVELTMGFLGPVSSSGVARPAEEVQKQNSPTSGHIPRPASPALTENLRPGPCSSRGHHQRGASSSTACLRAGLPSHAFPNPFPARVSSFFLFLPKQVLGLLSALGPRKPVADKSTLSNGTTGQLGGSARGLFPGNTGISAHLCSVTTSWAGTIGSLWSQHLAILMFSETSVELP